MSKHDLFWLAIKLAGLYLLVEGVLEIPLAISEGGVENQLHAYLPLVVGGILLGIKLRSVDAAIDGQPKAVVTLAGMTRDDCFWLVCKALGLWFAVMGLVFMPYAIVMFAGRKGSAVMGLPGPLQLAAGVWLLLSNALPNAVARRAARPRGSVATGQP